MIRKVEKQRAGICANIYGLGSRPLFLHIIISYRPSVVAVFFETIHRNSN